jgi:CheY-like chemotaxis protein
VVDDQPDSARLLALRLRAEGHDVAVACDGPSALVAAEERPPHIVLLDIEMPGMDGFEVARRLREQVRHARIVALSGHDLSERAHPAFDALLVKPVDDRKLLFELDQACPDHDPG